MNKILYILILGWLVTWTWTQSMPSECNHETPSDDFGRIPMVWSNSLEICLRDIGLKRSKLFNDYQVAIDFMKHGNGERDLTDFRIKEVKEYQSTQ